ncbi:hypothetical protein ABTX81_28050 [Kitasatospora sp. NPDC097605]|uniref:hypothetical protein n=1 Tax=Kitasatospora sp. NPDC097605 TaxID=3157226 RepID=UPI003324A2C0
MAELLWEDVREFFDPAVMGALPDPEVPDTSAEGRRARELPGRPVLGHDPVADRVPLPVQR